jgi:uncharacterized protein
VTEARNDHPGAPASPAPHAERIEVLDAIRGFALFGVLLANLNTGFGVLPPRGLANSLLAGLHEHFIDGRFYTLLGLLFGIGFSLQLRRLEGTGARVDRIFIRRLCALLAIGLVHGLLIWHGDILTFYAVIGFALLAYRRLASRHLPLAAALTFFVGGALASVAERFVAPADRSLDADSAHVYATGGFREILAQRAHDFVEWNSWWPFVAFSGFLTLFVIGMWLGRTGALRRLHQERMRVRRVMLTALLLVIVGHVLATMLPRWWPRPAHLPADLGNAVELIPRFAVGRVAGVLKTWSLSVVYFCAIVLLYYRFPRHWMMNALTSLGRMTLTVYLMQSLISTTIFYSYGLGWYGARTHSEMLVLAVAVFSVQMIMCHWWMKHHRFGPVEWLWRAATYGRRPALRRGPSAAS